MKLTAPFCARTDLAPGRYSDGRNLYLSVSKTGGKSWLFIYRAPTGKQRELGLGSFTGAGAAVAVGLKDARLAADAIRLGMKNGRPDPVADRVADRVRIAPDTTFAQLLDDVLAVQRQSWKPEADGTYEHETKWRRSLEKYCGTLLTMPVGQITDETVIGVFQPIWAKTAPTAISRVLYRVEKVMEHAIARKLHPGPNPARYTGHIEVVVGKKVPKKTQGDGYASLHYDKLPALWVDLIKGRGTGSKALAFTILTAARTDEARLARWDEVDFDKAVWTVPADRMKGGAKHEVPLSKQALDLLRSMPRVEGNPHIFTGNLNGAMGNTTMKKKLCDPRKDGGLGLQGEATVHGFRKTFRNWAGDTLRGYTTQDYEMCLAHSLGAVEGAYRTLRALETRREIMQAWADYASGVSNVARLRVAA